jgi:glucosamine-6-phosphate deaminase
MQVIVEQTADAAAERVFRLIGEQLGAYPQSVIGLPTGGTPVPVYARLVESVRAGGTSWASATTFNLDEYIGLGPVHPASYAAYMGRHLFDQVDCPPARCHIPNGLAPDIEQETIRYDRAIAAAGGMDLMFLGLGRNAHIGFNEPGSGFNTRTRRVSLTASTLEANGPYFQADQRQPSEAITMGIGTILEARKIVVLATGHSKADAVQRMIEGPPNIAVPGSALQRASEVVVVVDADAASGLSSNSVSS